MDYKILYYNDNNTAKVQMTIGDKVLEQDFDVTDLDTNVKNGMAVFQHELDSRPSVTVDKSLVGKTVIVDSLPSVLAADFEPVQVEE